MTVQIFATGLVAFFSEKLGVTFYLLGLLLALMVIDYMSGMAASAVEALDHPDDSSYGWSSKKGAKGIAKKVGYLFVIAVTMVIDYIIIHTTDVLGWGLPNTMLSLLVTAWYLLNESLSITENAGRMGAPVPGWLMKYIAALKNKIDNKGKEDSDTEEKK